MIEESDNGSENEAESDVLVEDTWEEETAQSEDVQSAVRSGRVRYKWKFAEYIKSLFG